MMIDQLPSRNPNAQVSSEPNYIEHITEGLIQSLSRDMAMPFCEIPREPKEPITCPIVDIVESRPDYLSLHEENVSGRIARYLLVTDPNSGESSKIPLPISDMVYYKGGAARLLLNLWAGSPLSMIQSEIPLNDLDAIGVGDSTLTRVEATKLGVDPEGIEMLGQDLNFSEYCLGRDTDHNQVLLGSSNLLYSPDALLAARSGHITLTGLYMPNRALYGTDTFTYDELELGTPRGLMRLIKPLAEGKALSFAHHPANKYVDCAPYFLFLARKWSTKPNFPILLQRAMEIGRKMGQIPEDETDPYKILDDMHTRVPLFDLNLHFLELRDVVLWKAGKLIRQEDRELMWRFRFPGDFEIPKDDINALPEIINLDGFISDRLMSMYIVKNWEDFKTGCARRVEETKNKDITPADRYFLRNQAWMRFVHKK